MKSFTNLFVTLALCTLTSLSFAAPKGVSDNDAANVVGIVTPDIATSVVAFGNYVKFRDTGEFAVCADGLGMYRCVDNKYLTPEQFVAKFYPKARYVGFKVVMNNGDTHLYLYIKKMPQ